MVNRPLADKRPFGPVVDLDRVKQRLSNMTSGGKTVVGSAGTPFPNRPKNRMFFTYVLDGGHIFHTGELRNLLTRRINGRDVYSNFRVRIKKSGSSSIAPFDQQAIIVDVPGSELPINDEDIHIIEEIINRAVDGAEVAQVIIDQE